MKTCAPVFPLSIFVLSVILPCSSLSARPLSVQRGTTSTSRTTTTTTSLSAATPYWTSEKLQNNPLMDDFRTYDGELVNPYRVLKVWRDATRTEIKQAYKNLSRKYHPDGARYRKILPGRCNNAEEIRDEWERIKLSYEILIDNKMRKKYDRHAVLADPAGAMGEAVGRAALTAIGWGLSSIGEGLFKAGEVALDQLLTKERNFQVVSDYLTFDHPWNDSSNGETKQNNPFHQLWTEKVESTQNYALQQFLGLCNFDIL